MIDADEARAKRWCVPCDKCTCPVCGHVYGTKATGEQADELTGACETCVMKDTTRGVRPVLVSADLVIADNLCSMDTFTA